MQGQCRFCGQASEGVAFDKWVKPTFTDFDKLQGGEIVCNACLFFFEEDSEQLTQYAGKWWATEPEAITANLDRVQAWQKKNKTDKLPSAKDIKIESIWNGFAVPQRMRNYSHFIVNGEWTPLSKGNKAQMRELLLGGVFPELAAIADSGQKHIVFRATRNPAGSKAGWVQFEEQRLYLIPAELRGLLEVVEKLYAEFSKGEIETGDYFGQRILKFGLERWQELEEQIKSQRGKPLFSLTLFLAQRSDDVSGNTEQSGGLAESDLARDASGLQEPLSHDDLDTVREPGKKRDVHKQSGEVHQPTLFET